MAILVNLPGTSIQEVVNYFQTSRRPECTVMAKIMEKELPTKVQTRAQQQGEKFLSPLFEKGAYTTVMSKEHDISHVLPTETVTSTVTPTVSPTATLTGLNTGTQNDGC